MKAADVERLRLSRLGDDIGDDYIGADTTESRPPVSPEELKDRFNQLWHTLTGNMNIWDSDRFTGVYRTHEELVRVISGQTQSSYGLKFVFDDIDLSNRAIKADWRWLAPMYRPPGTVTQFTYYETYSERMAEHGFAPQGLAHIETSLAAFLDPSLVTLS